MRISDWSSDVCSSDLFQPGSEDPLIFEVERKTARIGLDLLSLAPADSRSPSIFELNLPELPLTDPAQISSATDRVPVQFRRHFRELAPRMDSVAAARRSLSSIAGVSAEECFTNRLQTRRAGKEGVTRFISRLSPY